MKSILIILPLLISFFLGRESKQINFKQDTKTNYNTTKHVIPLDSKTEFLNRLTEFDQKKTDTVYRCGQSKIYHPTTSHGSFKRCRSKVYKLTVEHAKNLGLRRCKCYR